MATCIRPEADVPVASAVRHFLLDRLAAFDQTASLLSEADRGTVIDAVHDSRVICRQIISVIDAFTPYLRAKRLQAIKRRIRRINGYLGPLRDLDILLSRHELDACLRERLEIKREKALSTLLEVCSGSELHESVDSLIRPLQLPDADMKLSPADVTAKGRVQMRLLGQVVPEVLYRLAVDITAYQTILRQSDSPVLQPMPLLFWQDLSLPAPDMLHRLRISCKRFRYTLTMLRPLFGEQSDPFIEAFKELQDILGHLHDEQMLARTIAGKKKTAANGISDTAVWASIQATYFKILDEFFILWPQRDLTWFHHQIQALLDTIM